MPLIGRNPSAAAERARKAGDWRSAGALYEELGEPYEALHCWDKAGEYARCTELAIRLVRKDLAATFARKAGDPHRAATLFREAGRLQQAVEAFIEAGFLLDAAAMLAELGEHERAGAIYEQEGRFEYAANLLGNVGEHERAAALYSKAGQFQKAAQSFEAAGNFTRAAEVYERSGRPDRAAAAYGKADEHPKAAVVLREVVDELTSEHSYLSSVQRDQLDYAARRAAHHYKKAGQLEEAAAVLERAEHFPEAAELLVRLRDYARAGELFHRAGRNDKAVEMYERAGDPARAAKVAAQQHLDSGDDEEAAEALALAEDNVAAAEIFERLGRFGRAADCCEALGRWRRAAEMAFEDAQPARAAALFEKAGDKGRAAELYAEAGEPVAAASLYAAVGRPFDAARVSAEANREREMVEYLQAVPVDDAHYREAAVILSRAFVRRGWSAIAVEKLRAVLGEEAAHSDNLDLWSVLSEALEDVGELEEAAAILSKMLSLSINYRDLETRHRRVLSKIESEKARTHAFQAAGEGCERASDGLDAAKRYRLLAEIGKGGMGEVYRARDALLNRDVAYKVLSSRLASDPGARELLLQEARAAAALNHPNIITVHDLGVQDGRAFICMELVDGESYSKILKRKKRLAIDEVLHLLVSVCQGLDHAHHRGIVHRDLKPSNLLLTKDGRVKILDFGLAQPIAPSDDDSSGSSGGTPKYIAPEQALGQPTDARSDIYSLGATLFELVAGRAPFVEGDLLYQHVHSPPPKLCPLATATDTPSQLGDLIAHCLAKPPGERFQSAGELLSFAQAAKLL